MHPYTHLPDRSFWRRHVANTAWRDVPFMDEPKFTLRRSDKLATAGSCFAQHITRHMRRVGLEPFVVEAAHSFLQFGSPEVLESYGQFSARYGNVYTARQCLEMLRQAAGTMPVVNDLVEEDQRWFDLLRPGILSKGFGSREEALADRGYHLHCVRRMFETTDVFVLTLGLTECWQNVSLGYTYPVCPGTVRGSYQPAEHRFHNFSCTEVVADLEALINEARALNPALRFIFTVSPVPLVATQSGENVLVASSYSKAVLRAAVGEVVARHPCAQYFPSYEIISQPASFGQYLASDLREVTDRGVGHVMSCFLKALYPQLEDARLTANSPVALSHAPSVAIADSEPPPACEEIFYDRA